MLDDNKVYKAFFLHITSLHKAWFPLPWWAIILDTACRPPYVMSHFTEQCVHVLAGARGIKFYGMGIPLFSPSWDRNFTKNVRQEMLGISINSPFYLKARIDFHVPTALLEHCEFWSHWQENYPIFAHYNLVIYWSWIGTWLIVVLVCIIFNLLLCTLQIWLSLSPLSCKREARFETILQWL